MWMVPCGWDIKWIFSTHLLQPVGSSTSRGCFKWRALTCVCVCWMYLYDILLQRFSECGTLESAAVFYRLSLRRNQFANLLHFHTLKTGIHGDQWSLCPVTSGVKCIPSTPLKERNGLRDEWELLLKGEQDYNQIT